jgi:hypothetical protein
MDRSQAIYLLKEIYNKNSDLFPQTVDLIESKSNYPSSPNYTVRFKGLGSDCIKQVTSLVTQYRLAFTVKEDELTIFSTQ